MSILIGTHAVYVLCASIINAQLVRGFTLQAQRLEAAEAGLLEGEAQIKQLVINKHLNSQTPIPLATVHYGNYYVTLEALRLPQAFCIIPIKSKGYYYQLTAKAAHKDALTTPITLVSTLAVPGCKPCQPFLEKRQEGRSAWCQLLVN